MSADRNDDKIVAWADYGQHIPLRCKVHPNMRWSTKNIGGIGARSIFYSGEIVNGQLDSSVPECNCSSLELEPVPEN